MHKERLTWEEVMQLAQSEKMRKRPSHEEDALQEACIRWFDLAYPGLKMLLCHAANEGKVTKVQAVRRKKMGVRAGVADLLLLKSNKDYGYLAIELKTKIGRQSQSQKEWQKTVDEKGGGKYVVVRSIDEFMDEIKKFLF